MTVPQIFKGEVRVMDRDETLKVLYRCVCGEITEFRHYSQKEICAGCAETYMARVIVGRVKPRKNPSK